MDPSNSSPPDSTVRRAAKSHRRAIEPARTADADADHRQPAAAQAANTLDHNGRKPPFTCKWRFEKASKPHCMTRSPPCPNARKGRSRRPDGPAAHPDQGHEGRRGDRRALQRAVKPSDGNGVPSPVARRWPPWWSSSLGVWLAVAGVGRSAELEQLNTAIAQSEARLAELNRRGGKIELIDCGGRLCAHASTNQGEGYTDWKTPWTGKMGCRW